MEPKHRILIIEDQMDIAKFLKLEYQHEGYEATTCHDGREGLDVALAKEWDLILLDIMLPSMSGIEICRRIRGQSDVPIIMLTARDTIPDKVAGLDCGADDYVSKPFAMEEVLARTRALIRRNHVHEKAELLKVNDLELDVLSREVRRSGQYIRLTAREFDVLEVLMRNAGRVMNRQQLLEQAWGYDFVGETNVVDMYIMYLRNKVDAPFDPPLIHTVRGVGFVLRLHP